MSQELGYQSYLDQPRLTPRLIVAGIGLLLAGLCGVCILAVLPLTLRAASSAPMMSSSAMKWSLLASGVMVLIVTVVVVWSGVACFLGKRWVRPIVLILSAIGLSLAVPTVAIMIFTALQPKPIGAAPWAMFIGVGFSLVIYVGFPLAYLLMFRPQHVQELLDRLDPKPRWTDGIPVPLLGMSLVTLGLGVQLPWMILVMPRPMLFSLALPRVVAAAPLLVLTAGQILAAVLLYRQRVVGWWLAVGIVMTLSLSNLTNLLVHGTQLYDEAFGPQVSAQVAQSPMGSITSQLIMQGVWLFILLAAAIWVKHTSLSSGTEPRGVARFDEPAH